MNAKKTIARLCERIALLVADCPTDVVVWRHPGETEDEAIDRYTRQHPMSRAAVHVVSWEKS
jgi:hypothetical protein